jgi:hypothetical protein
MPYKIRKLKSNKYKVVNSMTGKIYSRSTTLKRAKAQIRLLGMTEGMKMRESSKNNKTNKINKRKNIKK